ncbi:hypothetical protein C0Q44_28000 [Paenibacillus sp. PCH8]|uniref:hypothetical protein n=1 Tax=Paenibacillus sp. PCH8 TaxID=2066524 RepID=UPI000CF85DE9|nr:hypothetical protein [Paenibacillus sp. PCH8]PQP80261.1 hypothetical protein C0Q44_28000 [Paenibacillus sp. PCH8]
MGGIILKKYDNKYIFDRDSILYSISRTLPSHRLAIHKQQKKKITKFEISDHGIMRWKERVGPTYDIHYLNSLYSYIFETGRVTINDEFEELVGVIDDDIIFFYKPYDEETHVVTTFLGRISNNYVLKNLDYLIKYVRHTGDKLNLTLSHSVPFFAIPSEVCIMSYSNHELAFEKFNTENGFLYYLRYCVEGIEVFNGILESNFKSQTNPPKAIISRLEHFKNQYQIASELLNIIGTHD